MYYSCYNLIEFTSDLSSLKDADAMFRECRKLVSFNVDLSSLEDGYCMFEYCESLTNFNSDLSSLTNGNEMFWGCNLNKESVQNIAFTINKGNVENDVNRSTIHLGVDDAIISDA